MVFPGGSSTKKAEDAIPPTTGHQRETKIQTKHRRHRRKQIKCPTLCQGQRCAVCCGAPNTPRRNRWVGSLRSVPAVPAVCCALWCGADVTPPLCCPLLPCCRAAVLTCCRVLGACACVRLMGNDSRMCGLGKGPSHGATPAGCGGMQWELQWDAVGMGRSGPTFRPITQLHFDRLPSMDPPHSASACAACPVLCCLCICRSSTSISFPIGIRHKAQSTEQREHANWLRLGNGITRYSRARNLCLRLQCRNNFILSQTAHSSTGEG